MKRLWLCGVALSALVGLAFHGVSVAWLLPLLLVAFIPYAIAVWLIVHRPTSQRRAGAIIILVVAVAARGLLLGSPLILSDDVHRYLWEGNVQNAGFNPYRYAPDARELELLRDATWHQTAHHDVPSAYPPLLLLLFRVTEQFADRAEVFKWIFAGFDLATCWLLAQWLKQRGQDPLLAIIWAWHPLIIVEFAGMGHAMSMAIFFFIAGLWLLDRANSPTAASGGGYVRQNVALERQAISPCANRATLAGLCLGAAIGSHWIALPAVAAVVLAQRIVSLRFWCGFVILTLLAAVPFISEVQHLMNGLLHFGARWEFNGSLFPLLVHWFGDGTREIAPGIWMASRKPKLIAAGWLLLTILWIGLRRYRAERAACVSFAAVLLFSPTVHPWYATWLVALLVVLLAEREGQARFRGRIAWFVFSATIMVSYVAQVTAISTGVWVETRLVRWLEYAPVFICLAWEWSRCRLTQPGAVGTMQVSGVSRLT